MIVVARPEEKAGPEPGAHQRRRHESEAACRTTLSATLARGAVPGCTGDRWVVHQGRSCSRRRGEPGTVPRGCAPASAPRDPRNRLRALWPSKAQVRQRRSTPGRGRRGMGGCGVGRGGEGWGGEGRTKAGDRQDVDWGSAEERNEGSQHSTVVHCAADKLFPCPTAARSRRKVPHATAKRSRERVEVGVRKSPRHRKSLPAQHHDAGFVRPSSLCYSALVLLGQVMLREVPSRSSRGHRRCRGARARHGPSEAAHST